MTKSILTSILLLLTVSLATAQAEKEVPPPYFIKTVTFVQNKQNIVPIFQLGDSFQLQFDDLHGNEANYYYQIVHCDYDWKQSQLSINEYLRGFDNQRIIDYTNSYNALQLYSHYRIQFPNRNTQLIVSGNYILKIVDESGDIVFSRKFIVYENLVTVPMQVKRARNIADVNYKHNIEFSVKSKSITFQSPLSNVKVLLLQNGKLDSGITNIKPMFTIGNDLIYKYDAETQFWAGNEFRYFENKDIRAATNNVASIDSQGGVYNAYLYKDEARAREQYSYNPDINGNFLVNNLNAENNEIEADYAWVYFTLSAPAFYEKKDIYVCGQFNNFAKNAESKMDYNAEKAIFEKAIMIKQGFTNYQYVVADKAGKIDNANAIDGNFFQTENNYFALIYYKENNQRYDRVIGKAVASSTDIIN
ncbi:MAG: DUF5103 domain-containing protein [Flavobacterium sp.]|nr:DUF5103 domain-containing protein [Flavobacterium sp.]